MDENYPRRRPRLEDTKVREDRDNKPGFFFTGFQTVVCIICVIAAIGLKQFGGTYYTIAKPYVNDALKKPITSGEVTQTFHELRDKWFPDAAEVFSRGVTSSSSNTKTNGKSAASSASESTSSESSKKSSTKASSSAAQANKSSSKTAVLPKKALTAVGKSLRATTGRAAVTSNAVDCSFTGGKDLPNISGLTTSKSQKPPSKASFAPYKLSIRPLEPVEGRVTSTFGYRINPVTKKYSFHSGIDIAAAAGTPIKAAYSGNVEKVGTSVYYGNYVILNNGNGIKTFYGHCETVTVKQGETVSEGTAIAKVGSTGVSTGYHLHFEIHINNICVNPQWVI